jgi:hypothetical protein
MAPWMERRQRVDARKLRDLRIQQALRTVA